MPDPKPNNKPTVDPVVAEARKQAARRLAGEAADARTNARIARKLADHPDHPADEDVALAAEEAADDKERIAASTATFAGIAVTPDPARKENMRTQVAEWKRLRAVHADMAANPDAYGGVDLGGAPIDVEAQAKMVIEYDAAIAEAEAELRGT